MLDFPSAFFLRSPLEERLELTRPRRMAQLAQRLRLDLPDALARDGEVLADRLERVLAGVAHADAHLDHLFLARRQRLQALIRLLLEVQVDHRVGRGHDLTILDEVAEMRILLLADRRLQRNRLLRDLQDLPDLRHGDVHALGDLFRSRLAPELLHQSPRRANQLVDRLDHVDRDADRPRLVGDGAGDGLADPPRRVGRELVAAAILELVYRLHQADVALLNQVEELQPAVRVLLRDRDDQPEVGLDQLLFRLLGLRLAARDRLERAHQLLGRLLEFVRHRLDLDLQVLLLLEEVLPLLVLQLRPPVLHRQLPLEVSDLTLEAHDRFDLVLDLVDHPALDGLGELDFPEQLRQEDVGAHALAADLAVLPLVLGGRPLHRVVELFLSLFRHDPRLADGVDLPEHLALAVFELLVSQLVVHERDQLADAALVVLERVPHLHDHLGDRRRARDRLDDGKLAALDPFGDLHFAFAGEQRDRPHLAQVHADGIVRLVEGPWREVELELLGSLPRAFEEFLLAVRLLGVDYLDAGATERTEKVVQLVGRGNVGRQKLIHLVVEQVSLLLADGDELFDLVVFFFDRQRVPPNDLQLMTHGRHESLYPMK